MLTDALGRADEEDEQGVVEEVLMRAEEAKRT